MAVDLIPLPKYLEDAFSLMEKNQPEYPAKLIEKIGAYQGDGHGRHWHEQSLPYFKGWAGTVDGISRYSADLGLYPDDLSKIGYVGLWVGRTTSLQRVVWCALPSMNCGEAMAGQTIEVGNEKVGIGQYSQEELDAMVVRGWDIIKNLVEKIGKYEAVSSMMS